jgi:cell division protein FtsL|tara:strand:+ start:921 stop:1196 length:276 start_codon:yes stop_codon:yes gene_type:complete
MTYITRSYLLFFLLFIFLCICLDTVKVRWQIAQEFENQAYLKLSQNKLKQINIQLQTEHHHLNSPAKVERQAKEKLKMIEINNINIINYEK